MERRDEIDGLRTLAILPVVLSHVGFAIFEGGYIGVDIFFVISGFLISSIILNQFQNNSFNLNNFYIRRAQRILPLLFLVTITTIIAFIFLLTPLELKQFFKSIVGQQFFSSNVVFFLESGYFDLKSIQKPMLHTWSLGVEEQFYIFFPFAFIFFLKKISNYRIHVISFFILLGVIFSQYFSIRNPNGSFYLIFSRFWELLIGVLGSFIYPLLKNNKHKNTSNFISLFGIIILIASIFIFNNSNIIHPGYYTLIPTFATLLVILFTSQETFVYKILTQKYVLLTGVISYSIYLWHQPIFVFFRHFNLTNTYSKLFSIIILFIFSYFSNKFIENYFRYHIKFNFKLYFTIWISFLLISLLGYFYNWDNWFRYFLSRKQEIAYNTATFSPYRKNCHSVGDTSLSCKYFGNNITTAVFGDSHGIEFAYSLSKELQKRNESLIQLTYSCPPAYTFSTGNFAADKWFQDSYKFISKKSIKNVFLIWRHSAYLFGNNEDYFPEYVSNNTTLQIHEGKNENEKRKIYMDSFIKLANDLIDSCKNVYIVLPIPEQGIHINKYFKYISNSKSTIFGVSIKYYKERNKYFFNNFHNYNKKIHLIDPLEKIGTEKFNTYIIKNDSSLYFDDNHLSLYGSSLLVKNIFP